MNQPLKAPIYLDHNATTPIAPDVLEAMLPFLREHFGNPMSGMHSLGWTAKAALEKSREQVAQLIGARNDEIIFTSGATESIHLAILGLFAEATEPSHMITCVTEHKSVLEVCHRVEKLRHRVTYLAVNAMGQIDLDELKKAITPKTILISLMHANNEIGTLHPISEIGEIAQQHDVLFHVDAAQTVGKHEIHVQEMKIDLLSLSAHKFYGPKGVGALFRRQSPRRVRLLPYIVGGGQERGLRGGTHNMPGIVGLGAAAERAKSRLIADQTYLKELRDEMIKLCVGGTNGVQLNGHPTRRLCNNVSLRIPGVSADQVLELKDVAFSAGSACASGSGEGSHVLRAIGALNDRTDSTTIRFGLGTGNTRAEIQHVCKMLNQLVAKHSR